MSERSDEGIRLLHLSAAYRDPNPGRDHITGLDHALRVAWLGSRVSDEMAFIGLVHDLARPLNDVRHGEVIAEVVQDRVSPAAYLALRDHGAHQSAIMHGTPAPNRDRMAVQLAAFEVRSFGECPAMSVGDAELLIRAWLS